MTFTESYNEIFNTVKNDTDKLNAAIADAICTDDSVRANLQRFLNSPSKRIRSLAAFLYLRARGIDISDKQVELQVIVELIHNASLVHDDVIDGDSVRRGQKTLNSAFGNRMAIISGDYILSTVMKKLTALKSFELFELFSKTLEDMCNGEILQFLNLNKITSIEENIKKSYLKTGTLFEASLSGAMILAGSTQNIDAGRFGRKFGIAFQVRDDLVNITEKGAGDVLAGIYNAPVIFSQSENVTALGIEKTKDLLNNYLNEAEECISDLAESKYKSALFKLLELFKYE